MSTYDAWFPRYAFRNRLTFSVDFSHPLWDEEVPRCPHFSTAACKGLTMTFSLLEEKVSAIVQKATLLKNKNQISVKEIYQFIGMCSATCLAVKEAPIHY